MGSVGAVVDEWKIETQRHAKWFEDAKAGNNSELERTIGGRPPEDYKGFTYEWVSFKGQDERTAFFLAAEAGHLHTVQMLAQRGADVREVDPGGETALHAAAGNNHAEVIRWLLAQGVPIDAQSRSGGTALLRAASKSHQLAVAHLLVAKASVDLADTHKNTALINATRDNKLDVASLLLFHGASVHATNSMNETPVTYAQERMTELLWSTTAKRGDVPGLRRLLARQIGAKGDEGWTELNRALFQPQGQDTHKLSMHRILCNCKEEHGFTGLSLAVQGGHVPAAEYLLSQTADVGISDDLREAPLHHAARLGHLELVRLLCDHNAPLEAINLGGATALHIAAFLGHSAVVQALIAAKANVESHDKFHQTPLHHAVTRQHASTIQVLMSAGASASQRDQDGKTVGDRATEAAIIRDKPRPRRAEDAADYDIQYEPPKPAQSYKVVHSKAVAVRAGRSTDSRALGARVPGEYVMVSEVVDNWAKLAVKSLKGEEQWMLIDGTALGLGALLELAPQEAAAKKPDPDDDDDDDDDFGG